MNHPVIIQRFPWRPGNRFELLVDGDRFIPAIVEAVEAASYSVAVEVYLVKSGHTADRMLGALARAARRGVRVRLLIDAFGGKGLATTDRERLRAAGVELRCYNPMRPARLRHYLFRDHRKLFLVDDRLLFTGGLGITDEFDPVVTGPDAWHDLALRVEGPVVADWRQSFDQTWRRLAPDRPSSLPVPRRRPPVQAPGGALGRLTLAAGPRQAEIQRSLAARSERARQRIWIATAYFVPPRRLRRRLARAARRGVDVRLLLPGSRTDHPAVRHAGRRFYHRLLRAGVRIYEFEPRFLHAKIQLVDDWVSIGSANLDHWNLRWNLEANQEAMDPALTRQVMESFRRDFRHSTEIRWQQWRHRSRLERLRERFWGWVDRWINLHLG